MTDQQSYTGPNHCVYCGAFRGPLPRIVGLAPTAEEQEALRQMFSAYQRLIELGWREAMYFPKDGRTVDTISCGSTGIHDCRFGGKFFEYFDGDIWPSSHGPALWREKQPHSETTS